ncbi:beta-galactosidase [Talaromyces pinophilus]|uniref:Beta-galactosidase n=1 Tax=Talaromyces pinophilus TaxID=128442 RepID=A0A6N4SLG0_TALPI|nr:beta-galactosidase [Talaromyces pinophilus]
MGGISQRQPNGSQRDWRHHPHDHITGDWDEETDIDIWAPKKVKMVTCNGSKPKVRKPNEWMVADNLPEAAANYDDSNWTGEQSTN